MSATRRILVPALLLALACLAPAAPAMAGQGQASCADVYKIYQTCYEGGKQTDLSACEYLVQGLSTQLLGEEGLSGFSAALTIGMCKRGCEDGANRKAPMGMSAFRREFCGSMIK